MESLKLAGPMVIVENASGDKRRITLRTLKILKEAGHIARMRKRKDGAITRAFLFAEPGEIGTRVTAQSEIVKVGTSTYWHTRNLGMLGRAKA